MIFVLKIFKLLVSKIVSKIYKERLLIFSKDWFKGSNISTSKPIILLLSFNEGLFNI